MSPYAPSVGSLSLPSQYNGRDFNELLAANQPDETKQKRVTLACLASHPDDEILSAGALLLRAKSCGFAIHLIWATNGASSRSLEASMRWDEALELGKLLRASVYALGMKDGSVDARALVPQFDCIFLAMKPDIVVCPHGSGPAQHQDHHAVHEAFANVARRTPYGTSAWIVGQPCVFDDSGFVPNLFLGYDNSYMDSVHSLMQIYQSEREKPFFTREFFEWRGLRWAHEGQTKTRFAEAFFLHKGFPPPDLFSAPDPLRHHESDSRADRFSSRSDQKI